MVEGNSLKKNNMLLVDYCDVFISSLDSHSDGTHSLQTLQCRGLQR